MIEVLTPRRPARHQPPRPARSTMALAFTPRLARRLLRAAERFLMGEDAAAYCGCTAEQVSAWLARAMMPDAPVWWRRWAAEWFLREAERGGALLDDAAEIARDTGAPTVLLAIDERRRKASLAAAAAQRLKEASHARELARAMIRHRAPEVLELIHEAGFKLEADPHVERIVLEEVRRGGLYPGPRSLARAICRPSEVVREACRRLVADGRLVKIKGGHYHLPAADDEPEAAALPRPLRLA